MYTWTLQFKEQAVPVRLRSVESKNMRKSHEEKKIKDDLTNKISK
jgi:hypothetical protein